MMYTHWWGFLIGFLCHSKPQLHKYITITPILVVFYTLPVYISEPSQMKPQSSQFGKCFVRFDSTPKGISPTVIMLYFKNN